MFVGCVLMVLTVEKLILCEWLLLVSFSLSCARPGIEVDGTEPSILSHLRTEARLMLLE